MVSVVYPFFTPPLSGIGKYQPKLPSVSVFHFGITVGIFYCLIWREHLLKISRELVFENLVGTSSFRGPKPPFLWEKGAPANFKILNLPTEFPFGIRYENTEKIPKGSYRNIESVFNSSCTWRNQIGYPAQPGLIRLSVRPSVRTYLQIRYSAENGIGPTDSVNYSSTSWIYAVNGESEILRKKSICESNTVNNVKLMILEKIRVICTCSSSPRAASVL